MPYIQGRHCVSDIYKTTLPTFRRSRCAILRLSSHSCPQLCLLLPDVIPRRTMGWWQPPGRFDGDSNGFNDGDSYMYRIRLETGQNYRYEVTVEGRDVVLRGEVHEDTISTRYETRGCYRNWRVSVCRVEELRVVN